MKRFLRCVAAAALLAGFAVAADIPAGERWLTHLTQDLLPFWSVPAALGDPLGAFPSVRCDDGTALDFSHPCAPIAGNAHLLTPARYLVALSRQTYGYGVAFHLTGDPKYLAWMRAGVGYIRRNAIDRAGGMFTAQDLVSGGWGPAREFRNPQELGYGLLGLAFYYYLTRDPEVLPDLLAVKDYIFTNYYSRPLGTMQWLLSSNGGMPFDSRMLVADLDQMNTYLVLLAPILPEPYQAEWNETMTTLSRSMLATFYSPEDNLFFTTANTPQDTDLAYSGTDFGHTSKALWMMRWAGRITGDEGLFEFSTRMAARHLERAYLDEDGSWAQAVLPGGAVDKNKNWWVYAELDQLSSALAPFDAAAARHLPQTTDYWFRYFVDHQYGEVWNGVDYGSNAPQRTYPKAWAWKSAYHSFEHALVGYIGAQQFYRQPAVLYYAFSQTPDTASIHPYFFSAAVESIEPAGNGCCQKVTFRFSEPAGASALSVVSAASFLGGSIAVESLASAWGQALAAVTAQAPGAAAPVTLGGASVSVTDSVGTTRLAALSYVSPTQVNFRIPPETQTGPATIVVRNANGAPVSVRVQIVGVMPGIFQSDLEKGRAAANVIRVRPDQSQSVEPVTAEPVDLGPESDLVYLSLYGTGLRRAAVVTATVGTQPVPVVYAGAQGTIAGLDQVNLGPLPHTLAGAGRVTIVLAAGGQTANPVELSFR